MLEVLDAPTTQPTFSDPNKAREAGLRSAELRQQLTKENEALRLLLTEKPIEQPKPVSDEVNRQIELTEEQVARVRTLLNDDNICYCETCKRGGLDGKERAALLREMRGLLEHLCRLHNIPQAPTTKANPKPMRSAPMAPPVPLGLARDTTGSVQSNQNKG